MCLIIIGFYGWQPIPIRIERCKYLFSNTIIKNNNCIQIPSLHSTDHSFLFLSSSTLSALPLLSSISISFSLSLCPLKGAAALLSHNTLQRPALLLQYSWGLQKAWLQSTLGRAPQSPLITSPLLCWRPPLFYSRILVLAMNVHLITHTKSLCT